MGLEGRAAGAAAEERKRAGRSVSAGKCLHCGCVAEGFGIR